MHFTLLWEHNCHAPNLIPRIVTMTSTLISSLNLILTITNLTFTKASLFLKKFDKQFQVNIINIVLHLKKKKTLKMDHASLKYKHIITAL